MLSYQELAVRAQKMTRTVQLRVGGMTCSSCIGTVTASLLAKAGVISAEVDLLMQQATVVVASDPAVAASDLVDLITAAGYEATVIAEVRSRCIRSCIQCGDSSCWSILSHICLSTFVLFVSGRCKPAQY